MYLVAFGLDFLKITSDLYHEWIQNKRKMDLTLRVQKDIEGLMAT